MFDQDELTKDELALVLELAPGLGAALFGDQARTMAARVRTALAALSGSNPADLAALADPAKRAALRIELSRLLSEHAASVVAAAEAARPTESRGAAIVSVLVLGTFAAAVGLVLSLPTPTGSEPVVNVLLGTLGAMATSVVGYWVGSSAGSARKDARLSELAARS